MGIALDKRATAAWKEAGEEWEAVSSRIVTMRMKLARVGQRRPGGTREPGNIFVTVISVHAPTARAQPGIMQKFMDDMQVTINKVSASDVLLLLRDLNAHVGSCESGEDPWRGVRGKYGLGDGNGAGERILEFCAINNFTIMSTWFSKKPIHLATWKHPATKQMHIIDYVVMRAEQWVFCTDVQVMRGASCWSGHQMVRANLRVVPLWRQKKALTSPIAVLGLSSNGLRGEYLQKLDEYLTAEQHKPHEAASNWCTLKKCILAAAEESLGRGRKKQPEWFMEAADTQTPLLEAKRAAHAKVLQIDSVANRRAFRRQQRMVNAAVDEAKEEWVRRLAKDAERAKKDGKQRWKSIRQLQATFAGRRPRRPTALLTEDGDLTRGPTEVKQRWYDHFTSILNIRSQYRQEVIDEMPAQSSRLEVDHPPTSDELSHALGHLKGGKAGGKTRILPELLKCGGTEMQNRLLLLIQDIWRQGSVVEDWRDAVVVQIPKKGDLRLCDNRWGISLLDVIGKVLARILQERLQAVGKLTLPESQCGFRKGRGCVDMVLSQDRW